MSFDDEKFHHCVEFKLALLVLSYSILLDVIGRGFHLVNSDLDLRFLYD
jgi:hypothetical protein